MVCGAGRVKAHVPVAADAGLLVAQSTGFPADLALHVLLNDGRQNSSLMYGAERAKAHVLVSTDAGLRMAESTGLPADLALIVHFDLPKRKVISSLWQYLVTICCLQSWRHACSHIMH